MIINIDENPDKITINVDGDIEMLSLTPFKNRVYDIARDKDTDIELDFANVDYIDSSGMGVILTLMKLQKKKEKKLSIVNCNNKIVKILQMSSLSDIIA